MYTIAQIQTCKAWHTHMTHQNTCNHMRGMHTEILPTVVDSCMGWSGVRPAISQLQRPACAPPFTRNIKHYSKDQTLIARTCGPPQTGTANASVSVFHTHIWLHMHCNHCWIIAKGGYISPLLSPKGSPNRNQLFLPFIWSLLEIFYTTENCFLIRLECHFLKNVSLA